MSETMTTQADAKECEDCGDEIDPGRRRTRCPHCGKLVCGWCRHHVHNGLHVEEVPDA